MSATAVYRRLGDIEPIEVVPPDAAWLCFVFEDASNIDVERWVPARDGRGLDGALRRRIV